MDKSDEKTNKEIDKKTLAISILMIIFLLSISYWRILNTPSPTLHFETVTPQKPPEFPSLEELTSMEYLEEMIEENDTDFLKENEERIYIREEIKGLFTFDYPSSWRSASIEEGRIDEKMEMLFLAHSRTTIYPIALAVMKIDAKNIEEATTILEKRAKEEGFEEVETIIKEEKEDKYLLEIIYTGKERDTISKGALLFIEDSSYFIFVTTDKKRVENIEKQAENIFSSIRLLK